MKINKPIFIVGSGRSGTTVFYNHLSLHPEVCWFSNYSDRFLNIKLIPLTHRLLDLLFIGTRLKEGIVAKRKFLIKPVEAERIYDHYCGFKRSPKTTENDFNLDTEKRFKDLIKKHLLLTGEKRFLTKQTSNTQRLRLINKMFDDAYYIHIIRDGRAVANSILNVSWRRETDIWWAGEKSYELEKKSRQTIKLCGLRWKNNVKEILNNKYLFKNRYIEVRYEDFVSDVKGTMEKVTDFCELSNSEEFFKLLPKTLPNMNNKWKKNLTEVQKNILNESLKSYLNQWDYN